MDPSNTTNMPPIAPSTSNTPTDAAAQRLARLELRQNNMFADQMEYVYDAFAYRMRVLARLPQLRQLDVMAVTGKERREAEIFAANGKGRPKGRAHPRDANALAKLHATGHQGS